MDRITNESNLWLNAIKMEDEGNYLEAFSLYLRDAEGHVKQNSLVRAALSCSCAADCLIKAGALPAARQLYLQAGAIYEKNGHHVIGNSVREALWSYQEAYEYYVMAYERERAKKVYDICLSLARKTNPFSGEREAMDSLRIRALDFEANASAINPNMQVSADIDNAVVTFLKELEPEVQPHERPILKRMFNKLERKQDEKSINN